MRGPTYTCKVCGQDFWYEATEMLRILPDHLDSPACRRARRRTQTRSFFRAMFTRLRYLVFGRPAERVEYVIRVPMEIVDVTAPGPIDLLAPAFEGQLLGPSQGYPPPPPLRWRRTGIERLRMVVDEQIALAQRQGLRLEQPVDHAELRRRSRCRAVYPERSSGGRRVQGQEEITILMTRR